MNCHGCDNILNTSNFLKCNSCASRYCYECLNVTVESAKQLTSLSCPFCQNVTRRRKNDDNTPVRRIQRHNSPTTPLNASFSQVTADAHVAMGIPGGSDSTCEPVTLESIGKLMDKKLAPDSSFMSNLRAALLKDLKDMVAVEVGRAIGVVQADFTTTTDFITLEQKDIKLDIAEKDNRIKQLELELLKSQNSLAKIQSRLSTVEKISRDLNLEIHEVPESKTEDVVTLFKKVCDSLQVEVSENDIKACLRVAKMNTGSKRPRNILVTLSSQRLRDTLLSAVTRFNKSHPDDKLSTSHIGLTGATNRIFLSEHLSPRQKNCIARHENSVKTWIINSFGRDREDTSSAKVEGGGVLLAIQKKYHVIRQASWDSDTEDVWISVLPYSRASPRLNICALIT
ncbi:unnamed protein product [Arctia plantaginis]|uniref:RING-type domain-containing protein n=1 Tax=Arctia plantaginis TaxID=874455 RepID=A0A8S0ZSD5_ARCPL|nr:unnamed protein product [Arctia plantaginis]